MDPAPGRRPGVRASFLSERARQRMAAAQARFVIMGDGSPQLEQVSKRQRASGPETQTTMMDSASALFKFKVDYEQTKHLAAGNAVTSDAITAGGHMWRINYYPHGAVLANNNESISIFVELLSNSTNVKAIFEFFLINKGGEPMLNAVHIKSGFHVFSMDDDSFGWDLCISRANLVRNYVLADGQVTFLCSVMVLEDSSIPVPPSDIRKNLGMLLDSADGSDVSFTVDDETFHAHRAVLAARSKVFRAELLGSMAEATMPSITLHDITPATFKAMLRFMYTDALPGNDELGGDSPASMFEHLLVAADRYGMDRLKLICAQKLWDSVTVDTIPSTLACAEIYNCPELKNKCIDFVVAEKNFKKVVLTEGFMQLGQKFPSIVAEVRKRVGA